MIRGRWRSPNLGRSMAWANRFARLLTVGGGNGTSSTASTAPSSLWITLPTQRSLRLVEYFGSKKKSASNSASVCGKERMSLLTKAHDDVPSFSSSHQSHMERHFSCSCLVRAEPAHPRTCPPRIPFVPIAKQDGRPVHRSVAGNLHDQIVFRAEHPIIAPVSKAAVAGAGQKMIPHAVLDPVQG